MVPRILNLDPRWGRVVSFTPSRFTPRVRAPCFHWRRLGGSTASLDAVAKRKIPSPAENQTPVVQPVACTVSMIKSGNKHPCPMQDSYLRPF